MFSLKAVLLLCVPILSLSWKAEEIPFQSSPANQPLILWWTPDFYPHVEPQSTSDAIEMQCSGRSHKCLVSQNKEHLAEAGDSRLVSLMFYGTDFDPEELPMPKKSNHMWALLNEESPQNNYMLVHNESAAAFNFSSTYKRKSDFPLTTQHFPSLKYLMERQPVDIKVKNEFRSKGHAAVVYLQSHCDVPSDRDRYVKELMTHLDVDSYGSCLKNKQFANASLDNTTEMYAEELYSVLANYKFHIAFENAICDDYVTEKLTRSLHLGSVPIYRGSPYVRDFVPDENAVIVADDFRSPEELARYIRYLDENDGAYLKHLDFKKAAKPANKHLAELLKSRKWSVSGYDEEHFVGGFECYVCDEMHKLLVEDDGGLSKSRVVQDNHLNCPMPTPSVGNLADIPPNDHFLNWRNNYLHQLDLARALKDLVAESRHKNEVKSVWDYIEKWYSDGNGALQHTEL